MNIIEAVKRGKARSGKIIRLSKISDDCPVWIDIELLLDKGSPIPVADVFADDWVTKEMLLRLLGVAPEDVLDF